MEGLATKYRPKSFEDVMGQENILKILHNQLVAKDTKQGYVFTGSAGTGKTTVARIFANAINDGHPPVEIDAASNSGVDHIREIREACKFKPLGAEFKVYLIDEVHMLSTGAFNALLKTLEEPPAHVVFILCTTDPQKIPPTILSRVQRFDFKRLSVEHMVSRLESILIWEGYKEWEPGALDYIAKLANGGMRDAISLADTCLAGENRLTLEGVCTTLGQSNYSSYINLGNYLVSGNRAGTLELIEHLHNEGKDLKQFVRGFLEFIVEVRKIRILGNTDYCSAPSVFYRDMVTMAEEEVVDLAGWFNSINELDNRIKYERQPKVLIEGWLLAL